MTQQPTSALWLKYSLLALALIAFFSGHNARATLTESGHNRVSQIETAWIDITLRSRFNNASTDFAAQVAPAYLNNDFPHIWLDENGDPGSAARELVRLVRVFTALSDAPAQHLWLKPYQQFLNWQDKPMALALPRYLLATDLIYSEMYARLRHDIATGRFIQADTDDDHQEYRYGRIEEIALHPEPAPWAHDTVLELNTAAVLPVTKRNNYLKRLIDKLYPETPQTRPLLEALAYWQQQTLTPWPQLPQDQRLDPGMIRASWVPVLTEQLRRLRLLPEDYQPAVPDRYDDTLVTAIRTLQERHGQMVDGIVGLQTRRILNMPPEQRVRRLAHNIRRLYHLPADPGSRYMMVNMADYKLELFENGRPTLAMKVIIGTPDSRTPIMKQALTSVILSPRWNIPRSISARSILPKARQNPDYLTERDIRVIDGWDQQAQEVPVEQIDQSLFERPENFPYRLVQQPGRRNLLGHVKFRLSNNKAIYLHDTPAKHLFAKRERAMSNGCVRLEAAIPLVERLLAHEPWGWSSEQIQQVLSENRERYLKMQPYLPVYLMYWTVWQDKNGHLQWRDDIYRKDQLPETAKARQIALASDSQEKTP